MLDKLSYMFKSWHLKRRYVHITIKMLQVEYGTKAPSMLRYHKHTRIETSATGGGFYCSLSKKLINFLLNNRMMSCSHLDIKVPKVMEQGRTGSKLKMVTPNHCYVRQCLLVLNIVLDFFYVSRVLYALYFSIWCSKLTQLLIFRFLVFAHLGSINKIAHKIITQLIHIYVTEVFIS